MRTNEGLEDERFGGEEAAVVPTPSNNNSTPERKARSSSAGQQQSQQNGGEDTELNKGSTLAGAENEGTDDRAVAESSTSSGAGGDDCIVETFHTRGNATSATRTDLGSERLNHSRRTTKSNNTVNGEDGVGKPMKKKGAPLTLLEQQLLKQIETQKEVLKQIKTQKEVEALVDDVTADTSKDLKARIDADDRLTEDGKETLLKRLDQREVEVFGNFFTLIDELFVKDEDYNGDNFPDQLEFYKSCCRSVYQELENRAAKKARRNSGGKKFHCRTKTSGEPNDVYEVTYREAKQQKMSATNEGQSRQSSHANARVALWPTDVVGQKNSAHMEIAHLVPSSPTDAESYWFVTDFLFGYDSSRKWDERRRLIHGSNAPKGEGVEKVANTGIKHMVTNKILLSSQKDYLDRFPCVILVPILSRKGNRGQLTALNWRGEAYDAIMLIDKPPIDTDYERSPLKIVAQATGYTYFDKEKNNSAGAGEVTMAMDLFRDYTRAIHYAQAAPSNKSGFSMKGEAGLFYPKLHENYENMNVRKISFASNDSSGGHPAPDPLLLLSKSISVLQARHGFKMMAAAEPRDDILPSDQSIQAEEDYLRWREKAMTHQDPLGMDILVG